MAIDTIHTAGVWRTQLGGPPSYMACLSEHLDVSLRVYTSIGPDFPAEYHEWYGSHGVDLRDSVRDKPTTRFVIDYNGDTRRLSVGHVCEPIGSVPDPPSNVVVSPIIGEVSEGLIRSLGGNMALDPQGLVRVMKPDKSIGYRSWCEADTLGKVLVFKSSSRELELVSGVSEPIQALQWLRRLGVKVAATTLGGEGSLVADAESIIRVPNYSAGVVDETGAGDAYLVGFFSEYLRSGEIDAAAAMGSACASAIVETLGPDVKIDENELRERMEHVKERIGRVEPVS